MIEKALNSDIFYTRMNNHNHDINYFKIGTFVLFGIGLLIAAILAFGSSHVFRHIAYIETYFDESVQGISEGSPVKYRGMQIGYVKEVTFTSEKYNNQNSNTKIQARSIYIRIAITSKLFTQLSNYEFNRLLKNEVAAGLRIKLLPQGLTGTTYLELNYVKPNENPIPKIPWQPENVYIPPAPGVLTQLSDNAQYILQEMRQVDFKELFANLSKLTISMDKAARKLSHTLDQFNEFKDPLRTILYNFETTSNNLKTTSEQIKLYPAQLLFSGAPPHLDPSKL